jgi:branched-chain amino acid transport system permease protein
VVLIQWLERSRVGLYIRAASQDGETAGILGVNTDRVSLVVVGVAFGLAGLAGALVAPFQSVSPGMGASVIVTVMIVVVIGGIGSISGVVIASFALGILQTLATLWLPSLTTLIPYIAVAIVLLLKPTGIAGKRLA